MEEIEKKENKYNEIVYSIKGINGERHKGRNMKRGGRGELSKRMEEKL